MKNNQNKKTTKFKTFIGFFFLINIYFFIFQFCALIIGFVTTGLTISSLLLYVIPVAYYKVFYALWVCLFYVFFSGIYSIMAPVIQTTFGQLNYSRDYGLVFTQSVSTFESIIYRNNGLSWLFTNSVSSATKYMPIKKRGITENF